MSILKIIEPDDWHVHFREGDLLKLIVPEKNRKKETLNFIGLISLSYIAGKTLFFSLNGYFETRYLATAIPFMEILVAFCFFYFFNKDFKNCF